jgi:hypothetical protein
MAVRGGAGDSRPRSVRALRRASVRQGIPTIRGFAKRFRVQDLATPGRGRVHLNARPRISNRLTVRFRSRCLLATFPTPL